MIRQYKALNGQTIYDICLMTYGTLDTLFKLMGDNGFQGVNTHPLPGQIFSWDDTLVYDQKVFISNLNSSISYATRAKVTGGVYYKIIQNGQPSSQLPVVAPVAPAGATIIKDGYFYVYANDPNLATDGSGNLVYTNARLNGLTGYSVFASQLADMIEPPNIEYNAIAGSFTIIIPSFYIVPGYRLTVFTNYIPNP